MAIYKRIYENLCERNKNRIDEHGLYSGLHRHHIIPKHSGGNDDSSNFTYLSVREHTIAHFLLWKIHRNPNDLRAMYMLGANLSSMQRKLIGEWCRDNKIGIHNVSKDVLGEWGKLGIRTQKERQQHNSFWWWFSEDGIRERASRGGKRNVELKINVDRVWINKNSVSKRVKRTKLQEYLDEGWTVGVAYKKSEKEINGTKARAKLRATCPHCGKEGQKINMHKSHFNRCKDKRTEMGI